MTLSTEMRRRKLRALAEAEGYGDLMELIQDCVADSVNPAICVNPDCDYTTGMEPDQDRGYCEACGTQTVQAALVLAELV